MVWQGSLFDGFDAGGERLSFAGMRRNPLDDRSWLDVAPGWVPDHAEQFDRLLEIAPWQQRTRRLWDEDVLDLTSVHDWHHAVPRERSASGARMSITLRQSRPAGR